MTTWSSDGPDRIGSADALRITSPRVDGTLRPYVPMGIVLVGADVLARR